MITAINNTILNKNSNSLNIIYLSIHKKLISIENLIANYKRLYK